VENSLLKPNTLYTVKYLQYELSLLPLLFLKNDRNGSSFSNLYLFFFKQTISELFFSLFLQVYTLFLHGYLK